MMECERCGWKAPSYDLVHVVIEDKTKKQTYKAWICRTCAIAIIHDINPYTEWKE